jgi:hypothetical protein
VLAAGNLQIFLHKNVAEVEVEREVRTAVTSE